MPAANVPHLCRLRHGGASADVATKTRTLDEVQKRGAWRSQASVARYAKPARLNQQLNALPKPVLKDLQDRAAKLRIELPRLLSAARKAGGAKSAAAPQGL